MCRKLAKGKSPETIAEELDEDIAEVRQICSLAAKHAPDYDIEKVLRDFLAEA